MKKKKKNFINCLCKFPLGCYLTKFWKNSHEVWVFREIIFIFTLFIVTFGTSRARPSLGRSSNRWSKRGNSTFHESQCLNWSIDGQNTWLRKIITDKPRQSTSGTFVTDDEPDGQSTLSADNRWYSQRSGKDCVNDRRPIPNSGWNWANGDIVKRKLLGHLYSKLELMNMGASNVNLNIW